MWTKIVDSIMGIVDKFIPNAEKKLEFKQTLSTMLLENETEWRKDVISLETSTSGVKWIDGFKHLIRPAIALAMTIQYFLYKFGYVDVWTSTDTYLFGAVIGFYFISRGVEKSITKVL